MQLLYPLRKLVFLFAVISAIAISSCKKSNTDNTARPTAEFINYTVNAVAYSFSKPFDTVLADTVTESQSFFPPLSVSGGRISGSATDVARIGYGQFWTPVNVGDVLPLRLFYTPQIEFYPYYATAASPIFVTITEFGAVGEYIGGNFSGTIIGAAPANTQYAVTCNFRVKRRI